MDRNVASGLASADYYDGFWSAYSEAPSDNCERIRLQFVLEALTPLTGDRPASILDFGCGRGWMSPFLSTLGSVVGVDYSPKGIEYAQQHYGQHGRFVVADPNADELGVGADNFDAVVCSEVIEHVPEPLRLLQKIKGFLKPNGWLVLTTPNGNVWERYRAHFALQEVENWLPPQRLSELLSLAEFRVLRHEGLSLPEFPRGLNRILLTRKAKQAASAIGLSNLYKRVELTRALYQTVVAQAAPATSAERSGAALSRGGPALAEAKLGGNQRVKCCDLVGRSVFPLFTP